MTLETTRRRLPRGWAWSSIQQVCEVNPPTIIEHIPPASEVSFVPMAAVGELSGRMDVDIRRPLSAVTKGYTRFQSGDVIFAKITPCMENGKIAIVPDVPFRIAFGSTEFHVLRPRDGMDPRYVFYYLTQDRFRSRARRSMTGAVGQQRVPGDFIKLAPIPVGPPEEQRRIAAKIDQLFGEVEAGEQELAKAREGLEAYRRSLLKAAVTGELTREWRKKNPQRETGSDFLKRILDARHAAWERADMTKQRFRGSTSTNGNRKTRYVEPQSPTILNLPRLPKQWCWATLDQLCLLIGGITVDAKRAGKDLLEVPYLRVANVQRGALDLGKIKTIKVSKERVAQLKLEPNDVLLNEGGDKDKVGRGWIWSGEIDVCIHQNHVFRARPVLKDLDGRFISIYANEVGRQYFFDASKQTTNLASISLAKVRSLPVPVPPVAELKEIISQITTLISEIDSHDALLSTNANGADQLRNSVLAAAFSGKLVPQDPSDEPARVLLERLRATRAAGVEPKRRATKKPLPGRNARPKQRAKALEGIAK